MIAEPAGISATDRFVVGGVAARLPVVAPGKHARRAVVGGEVDERDHRRELQLGLRFGHEVPHQLVLVPELVRRARAGDR